MGSRGSLHVSDGAQSLVGGDAVTIAMDVDGVSSAIPGAHELSGEWDRVMLTAADRPNTDTLPALRDPAADHEGEELARTARGH